MFQYKEKIPKLSEIKFRTDRKGNVIQSPVDKLMEQPFMHGENGFNRSAIGAFIHAENESLRASIAANLQEKPYSSLPSELTNEQAAQMVIPRSISSFSAFSAHNEHIAELLDSWRAQAAAPIEKETKEVEISADPKEVEA